MEGKSPAEYWGENHTPTWALKITQRQQMFCKIMHTLLVLYLIHRNNANVKYIASPLSARNVSANFAADAAWC